MKRNFTAAVLTVLSIFLSSFIASANDDITGKDANKKSKSSFAPLEANPGVYQSGWEGVSAWHLQKSGTTLTFQYNRPTTELNGTLLKDGVVVVFARNLWSEVPAFVELGAPDKPIKMPFYFLPDFDKPDYSEMWTFTAKEKSINLTLQVKGAAGTWTPGNKVEFRFVIISNEALQRKEKNVQAVRRMSYREIMETFQLN